MNKIFFLDNKKNIFLIFYSIILKFVFSVLQIGHFSKLSPVLLHSTHNATCPQLQNKILGGLVRHIKHSSSLNFFSRVNYLFIIIRKKSSNHLIPLSKI